MSAKQEALKNVAWEKVKQNGSTHYKTGKIEPIDLYLSLEILTPFCLASIIKYASRSATTGVSIKDLDKIIHYAQILKAKQGV